MSTPRLFTILLLVALFTMTVREIGDPDFWWHLRAGQYMIENATVPHTDPFSFTAQGQAWVTHEWLSEVLMYALYRAGGFALLMLLFSGIITLAFALTYARSQGQPYLAGFALLLGALATAPTWGVRPQMLTLLMLSVFLFLLDRFATTRDAKLLFPLPLLMIVWVNLHSGYAIGLVVIAVFLFAAFVEGIVFLYRTRSEDYGRTAEGTRTPDRARSEQGARSAGRICAQAVMRTPEKTAEPAISPRALRALFVAFVLSLAAVLLNPNGARMYGYPFETLTSPAMQRYIQEWFSPDFHQTEWLPFAFLLVSLIATALLARARVPLAHILLLFLVGVLALRSARNIPLFALIAIPVLSAQLAAWIPLRAGKSQTPRAAQIINGGIAVALVLVAVFRVGSVLANQSNVEREKFPAGAVEWIQQNRPAPNLYNSYSWGGYLIWRLYPDYQVYIDGRADVHGDAFIENYLEIYRASPNWQAELAQRGVRFVLIEPDAPLASTLANDSMWNQVYSDPQSVIYQKK